MATSSNFSTSNQYIKYRIIVTENSYSVANNTSNVTVSVRFYRTNTGYTTYGTGTVYCKINASICSVRPDRLWTVATTSSSCSGSMMSENFISPPPDIIIAHKKEKNRHISQKADFYRQAVAAFLPKGCSCVILS